MRGGSISLTNDEAPYSKGLENLLRRALRERVELISELAPDVWAIEADPGQIEQVLVNLAINARDAMLDGGRLVLQADNAVVDEACGQTPTTCGPGVTSASR